MSKKTEPRLRFSIVIPAYNEALYIAGTLQSLHEQDFEGAYEIIVVDNNSTDATAEVAKSLGVKVVNEKQSGVCFARQRGTEEATGEIIVSTDADTKFKPDWLMRIDEGFNKSDEIVAVTGPCRYLEGPIWASIYPFLLFGLVSIGNRLLKRTYYASATNIAFKKTAWHGYNTLLTQGGDELELLSDLRKEGRVDFKNDNPTYTSARRLARGLIYNFIVTFLIYYLLEYYLNKIFKRRVLGSAPKFRNDYSPKVLSLLNFAIIVSLVVALLITQHNTRRAFLRDSRRVIHGTTNLIDRAR